jgi:molybdate/tungstate transport system permease protein
MKNRSFTILFSLAGSLLVLFVLLPLAVTVFATTPSELKQVLSTPEVLYSLWLTFLAAGIATLLAAITGIPLAYLLARHDFPAKNLVETVIQLPVVMPHTAAGVALLMVFGRKGLLGQPLAHLGLRFTDNLAGIVVAMLFVSMPFLVTASQEAFALINEEMERVALIDGATPLQAFFRITLPQAWRGIVSGALMMWARGISEFGAVVILAYHPRIIPVLIYEWFEGFGLDAARPVAVLLILTVLVVFLLLRLALLPRRE